MRAFFTLPVLAAVVAAAPRPQDIDLDQVEQAANPVLITPPVDVVSQVVNVAAVTEQAAAASAAVYADPAVNDGSSSKKRGVVARDESPCAKQPKGSGPVATPDTVEAFLALDKLSAMSTAATAPYGYTEVFVNKQASLSASMYKGLTTLTSYDVPKCQSLCDADSDCVAFNMYAERDPTLKPDATKCPIPASLTNYKCTLWGAPVSAEQATNSGETRASFKVVITASNAYNKNANPPSINGFTGPSGYGGAINAPLDSNGKDTFMGSKFFPFSQEQGFTMQSCTSACTAQTDYNKNHPNKDGTWKTCTFVNGYVLSKNGVPQGLYCSMYTQVWAASYATNYGQYRGTARYTVSYSYGYTLAPVSSKDPNDRLCHAQKKRSPSTICFDYHLKHDTSVTPMYAQPGSFAACAAKCNHDENCWGWAIDQEGTTCAFYSQSGREMVDEYDALYDGNGQPIYNSDLDFYDSACFNDLGRGCNQQQR
ncbi:hypothetical protein D6C99_03762 [Aureobasidium pullulans]|nr:hypothetical protein D6C99_03762 [Aureobasidium pullulans]